MSQNPLGIHLVGILIRSSYLAAQSPNGKLRKLPGLGVGEGHREKKRCHGRQSASAISIEAHDSPRRPSQTSTHFTGGKTKVETLSGFLRSHSNEEAAFESEPLLSSKGAGNH